MQFPLKTGYSYLMFFFDYASLYNLVNKANLVHNFCSYIYFFSLHVLGDCPPPGETTVFM